MVTTQKSGVVVPKLSDDFLCSSGVWVVVAPPPPPEARFATVLFLSMSREKVGMVGWFS